MIWNAVEVQSGRVFVAGPRWPGPMLGVLDGGAARPYPDGAWNGWRPGADPARAFVNINSLRLDGRTVLAPDGSPLKVNAEAALDRCAGHRRRAHDLAPGAAAGPGGPVPARHVGRTPPDPTVPLPAARPLLTAAPNRRSPPPRVGDSVRVSRGFRQAAGRSGPRRAEPGHRRRGGPGHPACAPPLSRRPAAASSPGRAGAGSCFRGVAEKRNRRERTPPRAHRPRSTVDAQFAQRLGAGSSGGYRLAGSGVWPMLPAA